MAHKREIFALLLLLIVSFFFVPQSRQLSGQENAADELSHRKLAIRYAKTKLDVADVDLQRAMIMNERNIIPKLTLERIRSSHAIANEQHRQAISGSTDGAVKVRMRHAEERVRLAKLSLVAGEELNRSGSITGLELRRLQLNHELAKLNLMLMREPENVATQMEYMQRQIDRLGEDILSMDERISKLESRPAR